MSVLADSSAVGVWITVGIGAAGVAVAVGFWLWSVRHARAADGRAAEAEARAGASEERAAAREEEAMLATTRWSFRFDLRPVVANFAPVEPPVSIGLEGANMWVHEVRLSWRPADPEGDWTLNDAACTPWPDSPTLPVQLFTNGPTLAFAWPGSNPGAQVQLMCRIRVRYSVSERGPQRWRESLHGSTGWGQMS